MKIKPQGEWIFFKLQKISKIGKIELPDMEQLEKEDVIVLEIGPDVKKIKVDYKIILQPMNIVRYTDLTMPGSEMTGFVQEKNVIAIIEEDKND